ncbi:HipA family kinase [Streptacidiphilus albus]|uniref:HipA family kinase n=1 Tax=Streptacidiphilus albus TaxID=105425 RepID=UPI00054C7CD0|nr:HipA family kinase [Streptacidiphilus albus]
MLREVRAVRYVTALREGGSLPGLVAADDGALYVAKFRGAAQGRKALVAEVVAGELARRLGLRVPELVRAEVDPVIALGEPEQQVQELVQASGGTNLGMAFLSRAFGFDPLAFPVDPLLAGRVVWFDALIGNVDRSWRNPNLLVRQGELWLIDHGASLIFHHNWPRAAASARRPFDAGDHALLRFGPRVAAADAELAGLVTEALLDEVLALVPEQWLADEPGFGSADEVRAAYTAQLAERVAGPRDWLPEVGA